MMKPKNPAAAAAQRELAVICRKYAKLWQKIARKLETEQLGKYDARAIFLSTYRHHEAIDHASKFLDKPDEEPENIKWAMEALKRFRDNEYEKESRERINRRWGRGKN